MNEVAKVLFLENCGIYALENSIAVDEQTARVVTLRDLEHHLEATCPNFLAIVNACYYSLLDFLRTDGKQILRAGLIQNWRDWQYEVMDHERYYRDRRHRYGMFSELDRLCSYETLLFVLYRKADQARFYAQRAEAKKIRKAAKKQLEERQRQKEHDLAEQVAEEQLKQEEMEQAELRKQQTQQAQEAQKAQKATLSLSDQIMRLYHNEKMTQQFWANSKSLILRIQMLIDKNFPNKGHKVTPFGSTANQLCLKNADLDLCIRVKGKQYEYDRLQNRYKNIFGPRSIYNMKHLATLFKSIGMLEVEAITNAKVPICKFLDPVTGIRCDINTHNVLGIENTHLIGQYIDMDKRIRPLIMVIKYFVKEKNLNSAVGGTLSSYAYVIMVLHFLMVGLQNPVIPCLQDFNQIKCSSPQCKSKRNPRAFSSSLSQDQQNCDLRYHDCVRIQNISAHEYSDPNSPIGENKIATLWYGFNADSIAELLHKFFHYYSDPRNYIVSIIQANGELVDVSEDDRIFRNNHFVIQDPFIRRKNLARTCTEVGSTAILKEFQRAAKLTAPNLPPYNTQLASICDRANTLAKPPDTQSMEYRIKNKQGKMIMRRMDNSNNTTPTANGIQQLVQDQVVGVFEEITQDDFEQQLFDIAPPTPSDEPQTATPRSATSSSSIKAEAPAAIRSPLVPESAATDTEAINTLLDAVMLDTLQQSIITRKTPEDRVVAAEIIEDKLPATTIPHTSTEKQTTTGTFGVLQAMPQPTTTQKIATAAPDTAAPTDATSTQSKPTDTELAIVKLVKHLFTHYSSYHESSVSNLQEEFNDMDSDLADLVLTIERLTPSKGFQENLLQKSVINVDEIANIMQQTDFAPKQISFLAVQLIYIMKNYVETFYEKEELLPSIETKIKKGRMSEVMESMLGKQVANVVKESAGKKHELDSLERGYFGINLRFALDHQEPVQKYKANAATKDTGDEKEKEKEKHKQSSEETDEEEHSDERVTVAPATDSKVNTLKNNYASIMSRPYSGDSEIDVYFLVRHVPVIFDSYDVIQGFSNYGQIIDCARLEWHEDDNRDAWKGDICKMYQYVSWHVHIRTWYVVYTSGALFDLKLHMEWYDTNSDHCHVSLPSLIPLR